MDLPTELFATQKLNFSLLHLMLLSLNVIIKKLGKKQGWKTAAYYHYIKGNKLKLNSCVAKP
jgi:hypothetical protein